MGSTFNMGNDRTIRSEFLRGTLAIIAVALLLSGLSPADAKLMAGRKAHGGWGGSLAMTGGASFPNQNTGGRRLFATSSSPSNCTITFEGATLFFAVCIEDPTGFIFRWNDRGSNVVQVSVSDQNGGWVGFGLGSKMVGSSAVIAFPATGGNSAGGVYANQYYLAGQNENQVNPGGVLQLSTDGLKAEFVGGVMTMVFTLTLGTTQYPMSDIIFAKGGQGNPSTGRIPEHSEYYQGSIDWATGAEVVSTSSTITKVHGFLQAIVWAIIFPAGIISARFFRHVDPLWWHLHRAFQGVGFIVFVIALGLGLKAKARQGGGSGVHAALAVVLLVAVILQILAAVLRPKKDAKIRPMWNHYHHWVGRSAIIIATINVYIGLYLYKASSGLIAAYTIVWIDVLVISLALDVYWRVRGPWSKSYVTSSAIPASASTANLRSGASSPDPHGATFSVQGGRGL